MTKPKELRGFTLVEVLVVMVILAVLIGLSIAGMGYAMRRSRNVARLGASENMMIGLESYYTDHSDYPDQPTTVAAMAELFGPVFTGTDNLQEYLESTWDAPPESRFLYKTDGATSPQQYTICVNQEIWGSTTSWDWVCQGTGVGNTTGNFPVREPARGATCANCAGMCAMWNANDTWVACP